MRFSVIIPVYNTEKYLRRCIDSVLAQTFTDFELLLVDDGSTDGSLCICNDYAVRDPRIKVFSQPNGGPSKARNTGLDHAKGEYIVFMDSDDYADNNHLECYAKSSADIIWEGGHHYRWKDGQKSDILLSPAEADDDDSVQGIMCRTIKDSDIFSVPWSKAFKRGVIEKKYIRFREDIHFQEDQIFTLECVRQAKIMEVLSCRTYTYSWYPNSMARQIRPITETIKVCSLFDEFTTGWVTSPKLKKAFRDYQLRRLTARWRNYYLRPTRPSRKDRLQFIKWAIAEVKAHNELPLYRFAFLNPYLTDILSLAIGLVRKEKV